MSLEMFRASGFLERGHFEEPLVVWDYRVRAWILQCSSFLGLV